MLRKLTLSMHSIGAISYAVDISGIWLMSTASPHSLSSGDDAVRPSYFLKPIYIGSIWLSIVRR
jgi:hypothetical protein